MTASKASAAPRSTETLQDRIAFYTRSLNRAFETGGEAGYHEAKARLGRADLFYLLVYLLHRKDLLHPWVFERCNEVQAAPDGYLDLWAREHYKSTIGTFGLNVQEILRNPEVTIGLFSHSRGISKGFLKQIKTEFETNEELKFLYPDVLWAEPQTQAPSWSLDNGIIVKRKGNQKEATVEAWGVVDSQPTSKHFEILDYDDLVTEDSVTNPEQVAKTVNSWSNSLNLGRRGGRVRYKGTKWHFADPYTEILKRGAAKVRLHPATKDGTVDGEPVLLSAGELHKKRRDMGPYTFGCQMLLDPKADETQGFKESWLEFWPAAQLTNLNTYILVDPASAKKKHSDYTAMFVVGFGDDDCYRVVTMVRDRLSLTQRADALFMLHRQYRPLAVGYEEYGIQADIEHIQDRQKRENYTFPIRPLGGHLAKVDRIKRLVPLFEQHRILLPETCMRRNSEGTQQDLTRTFIDEEYKAFPVAAHDDMLDALSRICDPDFTMVAPNRARGGNPETTESGYDMMNR